VPSRCRNSDTRSMAGYVWYAMVCVGGGRKKTPGNGEGEVAFFAVWFGGAVWVNREKELVRFAELLISCCTLQ
jgi:hypothetical protein